MNPRYMVHSKGFIGDALYVKIDNGKITVCRKNGKFRTDLKSDLQHKDSINCAEKFIRDGVWREVKVEELVLII